jgi:hypothetical protein
LNPVALGRMVFVKALTITFRDSLLDGEIFYSLREAQIIVGEWVKHYNHV